MDTGCEPILTVRFAPASGHKRMLWDPSKPSKTAAFSIGADSEVREGKSCVNLKAKAMFFSSARFAETRPEYRVA